MVHKIKIGNNYIGKSFKPFVVAELSANHYGKIENIFLLIDEAKKSGADAIKLQTYHPDIITLNCSNDEFQIKEGTWKGYNLHQLYTIGYTPWEWHKEIFEYCRKVNIVVFSSPFDKTAVDLLESINCPLYKIASFELVDIPLIKYTASTGKPLIMSVGMADLDEISDAVSAAKSTGSGEIILLHCVSSYPAEPSDYNLTKMTDLANKFDVIVGLSDHTIGNVVAISSVVLGAAVIEKHFTLDRNNKGLDDSFSTEPDEFESLTRDLKNCWLSLKQNKNSLSNKEKENIKYRKSIYFIRDLSLGDTITEESIRCIRPGYGIKPKYFDEIIGKKVNRYINKNTPVLFDYIDMDNDKK